MATIGVFNPATAAVDRRDQATWADTFSAMFGQAHADLVGAIHSYVTAQVFPDLQPLPLADVIDGDGHLLGTLQERCKVFTDVENLAAAYLVDDFISDGCEILSLAFWGRLVAHVIQRIAIAIWDLCSTGTLKQEIDQTAANVAQLRQEHPEQVVVSDTLFAALMPGFTFALYEKASPDQPLVTIEVQNRKDGYVSFLHFRELTDRLTLEQHGIIAALSSEFQKVYVEATSHNVQLMIRGFKEDDTGNWWVAQNIEASTAKYDFGDRQMRTWDQLVDLTGLRALSRVLICP